jgi:catechol 2,3-dioxygenase-like lactoylglutathione lyase family enzyme
MIQKMSHATIYVTDQDVARELYVDKLGFDVVVDHTMPNGFRWLTVSPKGQPELEIILMKTGSGENFVALKGGASEPFAPKDLDSMNALLDKGMLSPGAFRTSDCRKTVAELKAKGVEFLSEPKDQFYGIEAIFRDPFGNWFSLSQPKNN